ncbi:type II toxin-antitoxin system HicA family toxin [Faecalibaculum rodentium]|jgi:predicted RNA binding protein YcfA (HicA-like mRNA interferase family)|uniref:type II toxin-antitoxin system HicA family toxin n=1 Tax=Faecalibaculum rodentium TaxID=1702221 RepID=UPI0023F5712F|nr:type II toxin-antitoxin system HicA family toxin [Faecalibaculum rodentium]
MEEKMTDKKLLKLLQENGWAIISTRGSHHKLKHPNIHETIILPVHGKDMKKGLESKILKQAGLK